MKFCSDMKKVQRDLFSSKVQRITGKITYLEAAVAKCSTHLLEELPGREGDLIPINNDMATCIQIKKATGGSVEPIHMDFMTFVRALTPSSCAGIWYDSTMADTKGLQDDCIAAAHRLKPGGILMVNLCAGHVLGSAAKKQASTIYKILSSIHCDGKPVFLEPTATTCQGVSGNTNMAWGYVRRTNEALEDDSIPYAATNPTSSDGSSISGDDDGSESVSDTLSVTTKPAPKAQKKSDLVGKIIRFRDGQFGKVTERALGRGAYMVRKMGMQTDTFMDLSFTIWWPATRQEEDTYRCSWDGKEMTNGKRKATACSGEEKKKRAKTNEVKSTTSRMHPLSGKEIGIPIGEWNTKKCPGGYEDVKMHGKKLCFMIGRSYYKSLLVHCVLKDGTIQTKPDRFTISPKLAEGWLF